MYILDKLTKQIQLLRQKVISLQLENQQLKQEINILNDQNDQMRYNNENMLLNIDKALTITKTANKEEKIV